MYCKKTYLWCVNSNERFNNVNKWYLACFADSKFNKEASTIKSMDVIRKAMEVAQQYRFEKDYTAPEKQCGKLSFIFEIEAE